MKLIILFLLPICILAQTKYDNVNQMITSGEFTDAQSMMENIIKQKDLTEEEELKILFEIERLERIKKDFKKSAEDVLTYVRRYYPDASKEDLSKWEKSGKLEYKIIDGEKRYFNRSHTNLFLVDENAKQQRNNVRGEQKDGLDVFLEEYIPKVVEESRTSKNSLIKPIKLKLFYELRVDADAVPDGEVIRCWLPFPREGHSRQKDIKLLFASEDEYIIADNNRLQRTIYMEKKAEAGKQTEFKMELEYTAFNEWTNVDAAGLEDYDKDSKMYKEFTSERLPHIVFTDKIKNLSEEIVGDESNPVLIAKKIYKWISDNIPWAGAREYSTIQNISDYCVSNGWGDCGIQTLTFMTLCRYNGIPAKWQSGWMLHPGEVNLHDWCEVFFEGYGWIPVDQSFKLIDSNDENVEWFFFGGIDAYHFIVNDDYSQPLFPAKIYPRSETVDFQRGEVEWRGGNLYFDQWDYNMSVEYNDISD